MTMVMEPAAVSRTSPWYADWQHPAHVEHFDFRSRLDDRNLVRDFEAFNDVRILTERVPRPARGTLVEVGCATGIFARYLRLRYPGLTYVGLDISEPVIARGRAKYPWVQLHVCQPDHPLRESLRQCGLMQPPEFLYAKDVLLHQVRPFEFLDDLLANATEAVILRLRTRDVGSTELDPERSCQYHYEGWMPYIVMNLQDVIARIQRAQPASEIVVYRHHMVLGGQMNRFLPKDCYLRETGTAETAVGVFLNTDHPRRVTIQDRVDAHARYTVDYRLKRLASRLLQGLR